MVRTVTQSSRAAGSLTVMFAAVAVALFIVSFAGIALAMESMQGSVDALYGKISAVDTTSPTHSLTLQSASTSEPTLNVFVNNDTTVKMCDANKSLKDIRVGSNVQITYNEIGGVPLADFIYVPC